MPEQPRLRLKVENTGDITVVHFTDKKLLDKPNIQMIGEELFRLVDILGRHKILLNFQDVEYLSSGALGKLITLNNKVKAAGGWLVLWNMDPMIFEVLRIAKLDRIFEIHTPKGENADAALARLLETLRARPPINP